ncbi:MAG: isocitrate lyase/PEP mutase family protein [Rhodovibrionaceae bacterium]
MTATSNPSKPTWKQLLEQDKPLVLPGAHDALSAKLIEQAGFSAFCVGGFPLVGSRYGLPDIGLVGLGEMAAGMRDILQATSLPALIDGDHGYGDVKNVAFTIQTYVKMGAGAVFIEDQVAPKRCGHMAGKDVVSLEAMVEKIRAADAARQGSDLFLMARTDARAIHGLDDALRRAEAYIEAGADGIFVEAPESVEELEIIGKAFDVPQFANMLVSGRTPILTNQELYDLGFEMIVHGTTLIMRVAEAMRETLQAIKEDRLDPSAGFASIEEFKAMTGFQDWSDFEDRLRR